MIPKLKVERKDGKYCVVDEHGTVYGAYTTKQDAEDAANDWREYYARPNGV